MQSQEVKIKKIYLNQFIMKCNKYIPERITETYNDLESDLKINMVPLKIKPILKSEEIKNLDDNKPKKKVKFNIDTIYYDKIVLVAILFALLFILSCVTLNN